MINLVFVHLSIYIAKMDKWTWTFTHLTFLDQKNIARRITPAGDTLYI